MSCFITVLQFVGHGSEIIAECFAFLALRQCYRVTLFHYLNYILLVVGELFWKLLLKRKVDHVIDNRVI